VAQAPARHFVGAGVRIALVEELAPSVERQAQPPPGGVGGGVAERAAGGKQAQRHVRVLAHGQVLEQRGGPVRGGRLEGRGPLPGRAALGFRGGGGEARVAGARCML
jgi:hypothetical protein